MSSNATDWALRALRSPAPWGNRRVAYSSQFLDPDNRAHRGKAKIKQRLIGDCDPGEWELPPKPKWMRWRTYNRPIDRFDSYEGILDRGNSRVDGQISRKIISRINRPKPVRQEISIPLSFS
jgi:hypothetical protein